MSLNEQVQPVFGRLAPSRDASQRVEFIEELFEDRIADHGMRLAWSRSAFCPCRPLDPSLEQPAADCKLCDATGYIYYGPPNPQDLSAENLTGVQRRMLERTRGFVIRGLMTSFGKVATDYDRAGVWERGNATLTVLADNKLYFRDRLVCLDTETLYREVVQMPAPPERRLPLRYLVQGGVLLCQGTAKTYVPGIDFTVRDGDVVWLGKRPDAGERLSMAYNTFATYQVSSMAHVVRQQNDRLGLPQVSPEGSIGRLPLMAQVSLTFIPHTAVSGG